MVVLDVQSPVVEGQGKEVHQYEVKTQFSSENVMVWRRSDSLENLCAFMSLFKMLTSSKQFYISPIFQMWIHL